MVTLVWFKRDLRVTDHPALVHAAARGPVVPVYIVEPALWAQPDASARQWEFVADCLHELRADLAALGAPLILRRGDAVQVLEGLAAQTGARALVSHEETGNLWSYARDRRVAAWARASGIAWTELPQAGVVRRLAGRDGWAVRREGVMRAPILPAPAALRGPVLAPGEVPSAAALGLAPDPCPQRQPGGRRRALALLEGFLAGRGRDYRRAMSSPLAGARGCSRLSPHLAFGTLSLREAHQAAGQGPSGGMSARARASFTSRLAWRDHFMQKLEDAPRIETACLHPACEDLRPRTPDPQRLEAWVRGETGLPYVDACMRALRATGWLNFRARAMLVSVASYHLWLDWRATGAHLARQFTDYEPGIHWPQMQMQSGTTGINALRIYNPVKQGQEHDPEGLFTRRWCPELAAVPLAHLHSPWTWEGAGRLLGRGYPLPVVDPLRAGRAGAQALWALRQGADFAAEARAIARRHASRREPGVRARFVRDPLPKPAPDPAPHTPRQLRLDL